MKKVCALLLAFVLTAGTLSGCGQTRLQGSEPEEAPVLNVTTTFAGADGNAQNYRAALECFTAETGIRINDSSAISDETFKARIETDFQAGSEPDVLFFFTGADANSFTEEGKVVSVEEIRREYPDYAANMRDELLPVSLLDGSCYAIPVNGFWEAMFCNTKVLEAAGVEVPGADYTWEAFQEDCQKIKAAGYTPIAASLGEVPHYWWEFSIFNHTSPAEHLQVPASVDQGNGPAWVAGISDIKKLYEQGFFPENTLSAADGETFSLFTGDQAAFLIDGSWKVGGIAAACQTDVGDASTLDESKLERFDVTYVPGQGERRATDLVGGLSMGYYITRKAWEDGAKRDAAVRFVEYMTSDEMVPVFAAYTPTALKKAPRTEPAQLNSLQRKALEFLAGATSLTGAVQDIFDGDCRTSTFDEMPQIVTGELPVEAAVEEGLQRYAAMQATKG